MHKSRCNNRFPKREKGHVKKLLSCHVTANGRILAVTPAANSMKLNVRPIRGKVLLWRLCAFGGHNEAPTCRRGPSTAGGRRRFVQTGIALRAPGIAASVPEMLFVPPASQVGLP